MPAPAAPASQPNTHAPLEPTQAGETWPRAIGGSALAWSIVALMQASANFTDQVRRGATTSFVSVVGNSLLGWWPWAVFTAVIYIVLSRRAQELGDRTAMARLFVASLIVFFIPQIAYQVILAVHEAPGGRSFRHTFATWPANFWLIDFGILVAACTVVYAMVVARERARSQRRRQQLDAENLALRLELEQQRVVALRAQLEPHFLFNALNAISGLVRGSDKSLAISALTRLSELLRYALTASSRDWVTVGDELHFVRGYAMLQQLRYGDRLQLTIAGDDDTIRSGDCPPLLLQPLVENAIRHDLESHAGASDIRMNLALRGERLAVDLTNPIHPEAVANAGLGLGLRSTRERLALLYGPDASFEVGAEGGRFAVHLEIPLQAP